MKRFVKRHEGRIVGTIAGFDRVLFRGNLSSICHLGGMDRFLSSQGVLYKDSSPLLRRFLIEADWQRQSRSEMRNLQSETRVRSKLLFLETL
jgi:hypothetical protein